MYNGSGLWGKFFPPFPGNQCTFTELLWGHLGKLTQECPLTGYVVHLVAQ